MTRHDNLDRHLSRALHHRIEVIHFEPQQHAISVWLIITVADGAVRIDLDEKRSRQQTRDAHQARQTSGELRTRSCAALAR